MQISFFMISGKREATMAIYWKDIEAFRQQKGIEKAELARRTGMSERSIYLGIRSNAKLRGATLTVMRGVFPDEIAKAERGAA